jgi:hypothetical protein
VMVQHPATDGVPGGPRRCATRCGATAMGYRPDVADQPVDRAVGTI